MREKNETSLGRFCIVHAPLIFALNILYPVNDIVHHCIQNLALDIFVSLFSIFPTPLGGWGGGGGGAYKRKKKSVLKRVKLITKHTLINIKMLHWLKGMKKILMSQRFPLA